MRLIRLLLATRRTVPRAFALLRHPRVPLGLKAAAIAAALLVISPLDPLADIPVIGLFDDVALLALLANVFVSIADRTLLKTVVESGAATVRRAGAAALKP